MSTSATQHAIGALKLAGLHLDHPSVIPGRVLRAACTEAIDRLQLNQPHAHDLGRLYCSLFDALPRGYLPHVTLTTDPAAPFACVITNATGDLVDRQAGKTIEGITEIIRLRHSAGRGEARA